MNQSLDIIRDNLMFSTRGLVERWSKIFLEFQLKLLDGGAEEANEYLASCMDQLDNDFHLYFIALADVLQKRGLTEAAESQRKLAQNFLSILKAYKISRMTEIAQGATGVAEVVSKDFQSTSYRG